MSDYTKTNLQDVRDLAPEYGMAEFGEARFAREAIGAERIGTSYYKVNPGRRVGFGHHHDAVEEMYLVLSGTGRFKLDDEIVEVGPRDLVYVPPQTMREWEAGEEGLELIAFGAHSDDEENHMQPGWWTDQ